MALRDELVEALECPALVAETRAGFLHHRKRDRWTGEILTLAAVIPGRGVGTALIDAYVDPATREGLSRITVVTTNDNLEALRFDQRRGFEICGIRFGAASRARRSLKPERPETGLHGIPIRDETKLVRDIG